MKRTKHGLSHYKLLSCDMGELIPVSCFEVLPGDSVAHATSALIRVSPLLAPVMHPISVRVHHWFVPNRLVWDDWEPFITGGSDGEGEGSSYPVIDVASFAAGALGDYLGLPPGVDLGPVSALPFRAYNLIFNEFYRDADLVSARALSTAGGTDATTAVTLAKIAWEKDRFTTARPWPQKGPDVSLPLGTTAPVISDGNGIPTYTIDGNTRNLIGTVGNATASWSSGNASGSPAVWLDPKLQADLTNATAVNVNDVRLAFALQRYQEARAQYGHRYAEYLRFLGVRSSDARLQRPEYLGGGKQTISFSEVLQTAPTTDGDDTEGVGNLKGHGIAAVRSRRYRRFFEEHGHVLSLMSVRPKTMYGNGLNKMWSRTTKEDYWQRELEKIGQEEILNKEVYVGDSAPNDVFGYNDRYSDYRSIPSSVAGEFRSTLNYWHMARIFAGDVTLNSDFVTADPTKRINAVQSADVLWCMVNNSVQARRMVARGGGIGRIV